MCFLAVHEWLPYITPKVFLYLYLSPCCFPLTHTLNPHIFVYVCCWRLEAVTFMLWVMAKVRGEQDEQTFWETYSFNSKFKFVFVENSNGETECLLSFTALLLLIELLIILFTPGLLILYIFPFTCILFFISLNNSLSTIQQIYIMTFGLMFFKEEPFQHYSPWVMSFPCQKWTEIKKRVVIYLWSNYAMCQLQFPD